jgi:hypothetical protein
VPGTIWSRCARPLIPAVIASGAAARQPSAATAGVTLAEIAELIALDSTNDCARGPNGRRATGRAGRKDRRAEGRADGAGAVAQDVYVRNEGPCPILEAFEE